MILEKRTYNKRHILSAIGMIISMLWLTVSLPIVYTAYQQYSSLEQSATTDLPIDEDDSTPLSNTNEEKSPSPISVTEEMLHGHHDQDAYVINKLKHEFHRSFDPYMAYHGEQLFPPPDLVRS